VLYDAVIIHAREQGIEKISDFIRDAIRQRLLVDRRRQPR
jgi:hypothetical protein